MLPLLLPLLLPLSRRFALAHWAGGPLDGPSPTVQRPTGKLVTASSVPAGSSAGTSTPEMTEQDREKHPPVEACCSEF